MTMRVSVAARCRVMINGRYVLVISINGRERGDESLGPAGGGIKTTKLGLDQLVKEFGINPETFEKGTDLRFVMDTRRLEDLRGWLASTKQLEPAPAMREFAEEMEQRKILTLEEAQLVTFQLATRHEDDMKMWSYKGGELKQVETHCIEWIYDTILPPDISAALVRASQQPDPLIELVTAEEIKRGHSKRGSKIEDWTRFLL